MKLWTVNELANKYKVDSSTVRGWLRKKIFPHAQKTTTSNGETWFVPDIDLKNFSRKPPSENTLRARGRSYHGPDGRRSLTDSQIKDVLDFYIKGHSQNETSLEFRLPLGRVNKLIKAAGINPRPRTVSGTYRQKMRERRKMPAKELILDLYIERGLPRDEILKRLAISDRTFYGLLNYYGIERRRFRAKKQRSGRP